MADTLEKPGRSSRWMRILLGLSLALNLLIFGVIAGAMMRPGGPGPRGSSSMMSYAMPYVQALPRETRREIFRAVRRAAPDGSTSRQARRASYAEMIEALRATPFDASQVQVILDRQNGSAVTMQSAAQAAWLDQIADMSNSERSEYADAVSEVLARGPRKRGSHTGQGD